MVILLCDTVESNNIKVYKNSDILRIVALIPPHHKHLRLVIVTKDQTIVLHEATVAAIVRAYVNVVLHPIRKAIEYVQTRLDKKERKPEYAEYQLIEKDKREEEILNEWSKLLYTTEYKSD